MKNYLIVLLYLVSSVSLALPPYDSQGRLFGAPLTFKEITTPSAPAANQISLYAKGDDKLYFQTSLGVEKPVGSGDGASGDYGYLVNGGFEDAASPTTGWTLGSGVTSALALDPIEGKQAVTLSFTSLNGTALSQCLTTPTSLTGQTMGYEIQVKTSTANLQVCSMRDNAEIQCADVASDGNWHKILFNYPGSGSLNDCVKVKTTTSTTGNVTADAGYLGLARNLGTVSQASYFGGMEQVGIAGGTCAYSENASTGLNNFVDLGSGSGCNSWTTSGSVSAAGTNSHSIVLNNMKPGSFKIELIGVVESTASGVACNWRLTDGTKYYQPQVNGVPTSNNLLSFQIDETVGATRTYHLQAADSGAGTCLIDNSIAGTNLAWKVYYFPSQSQIVTQNPVSDFGRIFPWLNATCPANSEPLDGGTTTNTALISFLGSSTRPDWRALYPRMAGSQTIGGVTYSATLGATQGDQMQGHTHTAFTQSTTDNSLINYQQLNQSTNLLPGTNYSINRTSITSTAISDPVSDGTNGTPRTGTETRPPTVVVNFCISTATMSAPLVVGGVSTSSSGEERIERATITPTSSSVCTINSQSGSWISSTTPVNVGQCTINFARPFATKPTCNVTQETTSYPTAAAMAGINTISTSSLTFYTGYFSGAPAFGPYPTHIICVGPTQ